MLHAMQPYQILIGGSLRHALDFFSTFIGLVGLGSGSGAEIESNLQPSQDYLSTTHPHRCFVIAIGLEINNGVPYSLPNLSLPWLSVTFLHAVRAYKPDYGQSSPFSHVRCS
jgi:hypothetical protein